MDLVAEMSKLAPLRHGHFPCGTLRQVQVRLQRFRDVHSGADLPVLSVYSFAKPLVFTVSACRFDCNPGMPMFFSCRDPDSYRQGRAIFLERTSTGRIGRPEPSAGYLPKNAGGWHPLITAGAPQCARRPGRRFGQFPLFEPGTRLRVLRVRELNGGASLPGNPYGGGAKDYGFPVAADEAGHGVVVFFCGGKASPPFPCAPWKAFLQTMHVEAQKPMPIPE